jgi:hypothetical protein
MLAVVGVADVGCPPWPILYVLLELGKNLIHMLPLKLEKIA